MRIIAGEQSASRWPAACSVVELRETQAVFREPIKIRRGDFAAVATNVGITEIVSEYEDNVWPSGFGRMVLSEEGQAEECHSESGLEHLYYVFSRSGRGAAQGSNSD